MQKLHPIAAVQPRVSKIRGVTEHSWGRSLAIEIQSRTTVSKLKAQL